MPATVLHAVPLLTKITQDVNIGRIVDPKALQTALEDVILRLNAQQASEPIDVQDDNLSDILLEMKSITEKVESCTTRLARFQTASNPRPIDHDTAVALKDASVQATPEAMSAALVPLPAPAPSALPPPDPANPHIKRARVYFPSTPRAVTIYPPGNPGYQTLIRDSDGNVVIALDEHELRNPLRRQGAFSGENQLRGLFNLNAGPGSPRINVRRPLCRQDAFCGARHLRQVHGLRWSLHSSQSAIAGVSTDQTAQSSWDAESRASMTLMCDVASASQPVPPPTKRTRRHGLDEAIKEEQDEAKSDTVSTPVTQVSGPERVRSSAVTRAQKRARSDAGRVKEEDESKPVVASISESQPRRGLRVTRSQNSRRNEMVKKEENVDDGEGDREENGGNDEGEEVKEEEVEPVVSTRPHPTDPPPATWSRLQTRDESEAKDEEKKVVPTPEARVQPQRGNRVAAPIIANMRPKTRKRVRDEGSSGAEKKEGNQPSVLSTNAIQNRPRERAESRPSVPLPRRRNRTDEGEPNSQRMAHPDARCVREPALKRRRL